jgi:hypothetical protein
VLVFERQKLVSPPSNGKHDASDINLGGN